MHRIPNTLIVFSASNPSVFDLHCDLHSGLEFNEGPQILESSFVGKKAINEFLNINT